ncbi:putative adenylate cyclase [Talaromyces proteolyticus]|uniref:Adenylate cyclase n=1 Tax=Talaromyces proteolyticus TaxID=1131652 RepID=A0AAD4KTI8_9EURO|nr:putative adenylate cyclase [Talaromyces proteolyticus]KAH8698957.1 putative adenylate cyclase [Talaromyces proteolyticus]
MAREAAFTASSSSTAYSSPPQTMSSTVDTASEQTPLLSSPATHDDETVPTTETTDTAEVDLLARNKHIWRLCFTVFTLVQAANVVLQAPLIQLKEDSVCMAEYGSSRSLGEDCKVQAVQDEVTTLTSWQQLFDTAPGILFGVFYGMAADRYGRRPVLALALAGIVLSAIWTQIVLFWPAVFPARLTWLSIVFQLVGGGNLVVNAMIFAIVSDVTPEEKRSSKFFRLYGVALLSDMILSPASDALTNIQPWWPARFGLIAFIMALLATWLVLPETLSMTEVVQSIRLEENEPEEEDDPVVYTDVQKSTIWRRVRKIMSSLQDLRYLIASRQLLLLVPLLSVGQLYDQSAEFFKNYISKRYGWRMSQASFWLTYRNVVNLILLSTILPGISEILLRRNFDAGRKDQWISRASIVCLAVGAFIVGLAPILSIMVTGLTIFALGHGFVPAVLSLATPFIEPGHIGMLYTAMTIGEAIGKLANEPVLVGAFELGMKVGGLLLGLPFVATGIMLTIAGVSVFGIRQPLPATHLD